MLRIGGFTPLSTTDWPDQLAAVVFVQGCPWRCHYCHNVDLQDRDGGLRDGWPQVLQTLSRRQGLLDGVVFSGGEPTLDPHLVGAIDDVRQLGLKVGLHTAGIYPDRLIELLPKVDWVGFDVKTDFAAYASITAIPRSGLPAWRSLLALVQAVQQQGLSLEVRTTWHPELQSDDQMVALAQALAHQGIRRWVIQQFRAAHEQHASLASTWHPPGDPLWQRLMDTGLSLELR